MTKQSSVAEPLIEINVTVDWSHYGTAYNDEHPSLRYIIIIYIIIMLFLLSNKNYTRYMLYDTFYNPLLKTSDNVLEEKVHIYVIVYCYVPIAESKSIIVSDINFVDVHALQYL